MVNKLFKKKQAKRMLARAREARRSQWSLQKWVSSPGLYKKTEEGTSCTKYTGQKFDPDTAKVVEDGWDHDHCWFCTQSICACGSENCQPEGFTNGDQWICKTCYQKFIVEEPMLPLDLKFLMY